MQNFLLHMLISAILQLYRAGGREAVVRALTIPQKDIKAITDKTHVDLGEALAARDAWAEASANLAEQLILPEGEEDF